MALAYQVPGVYFEPRPRVPEAPQVRTDVAGFIGLEPRVRDGTTPSALIGNPPSGHAFRVDVAALQVVVGGIRCSVSSTTNFSLSQSASSVPLSPGQTIVYAVTVARQGSTGILIGTAGNTPTSTDGERPLPPTDAEVDNAVTAQLAGKTPWTRLVDVHIRYEGTAIWLTVHPTPDLSITRCDDFRDYVLTFGTPIDDGTLLGPAVRAYFANGGRRCWIATLRRPIFTDTTELSRVLVEAVGVQGSSEIEATGLERLLLVPDVTFVDVPDLYARRVDHTVKTLSLPPRDREACFISCDERLGSPGVATTNSRDPAWEPIFDSSDVLGQQIALLQRCIPERWRILLLLSVPLTFDAASGTYRPPEGEDAAKWIGELDSIFKGPGFGDTDELACSALYWPWVLYQEQVGAPVLEMPPSPYAAGVIARRDLARGPQISPANETLKQVVGLAASVTDENNGPLYSPADDKNGFPVPSVNVLRAFPGYGIQVWGARTLSTETWLRYLAVRRTLTAIELRMKAALDLLVFEPNTPMLWLQITHIAFSVLIPIFESGALRGDRPEEAFYVRCDGTINPPETVAAGQLFVEIGVAVAAPAEFLVFRVGRREGVVEVVE